MVYVDNMEIPFRLNTGRFGKMSHMIADTEDELHEMASKLGLKREWFQNKGKYPHYDVTKSRKKLAVEFGAIEIDIRDLVKKAREIQKNSTAF